MRQASKVALMLVIRRIMIRNAMLKTNPLDENDARWCAEKSDRPALL
jgi:hypothetical protein